MTEVVVTSKRVTSEIVMASVPFTIVLPSSPEHWVGSRPSGSSETITVQFADDALIEPVVAENVVVVNPPGPILVDVSVYDSLIPPVSTVKFEEGRVILIQTKLFASSPFVMLKLKSEVEFASTLDEDERVAVQLDTEEYALFLMAKLITTTKTKTPSTHKIRRANTVGMY